MRSPRRSVVPTGLESLGALFPALKPFHPITPKTGVLGTPALG
ncbi:MAG: hypothetical protein WCB94_03115 [Terriglobales bacterium]